MALAFLFMTWVVAGLGAAAALLERRAEITTGWKQLDKTLDPTEPMVMSIALRQPEIRRLSEVISSGARLSMEQVLSLRQPDPRESEDVVQWLASNDISEARVEKDWIHVRTTVTKAEQLMQTKFHHYSFEGKEPIVRTTKYSVPGPVSNAIDFIHPISNFMTPRHDTVAQTIPPRNLGIRKRADTPPCDVITSPDCIKKIYKLDYQAPDGKSPVRFAVGGFLNQYSNYADVDDFLRRTQSEIASKGYNFSVELVNGGENPQDRLKAGTEANLNIQYAMAIGYPTEITYFSTGGKGVQLNDSGQATPPALSDNEPFLELIEHLLGMPEERFPHVLSLSYADDELSVPRPYAERVCDMFGMLAGRGMSIVVESGDGGARGHRNSTCRTNDGHNLEITMATFPGTCPWVTAVGAVTNSDNPPKGAFFSGGGFSQVFDRPKWQSEAVNGYIEELQGHLTGFYNPKKRAVPDISAIGTQYLTVVNGKDVILDGTSASAAVFASMIALANDARLRKGKASLGWLNPKLYSSEVRRVLVDTTGGVSKPCKFSGGKSAGWPATKGWDAVTGLGTPGEFDKLLRVLVDGN